MSTTTGMRRGAPVGNRFGLRVTATDEGTRIWVEGAVDRVTFDVFRAAVLGAGARCSVLTVDLSDVTHVDADTLRLLEGLARRMRRFGRRLHLVGAPQAQAPALAGLPQPQWNGSSLRGTPEPRARNPAPPRHERH